MILLLEVLSSVKNRESKHPKPRSKFVDGKPNFQKTKTNNFQHYYIEPISATYKILAGHDNVWILFIKG